MPRSRSTPPLALLVAGATMTALGGCAKDQSAPPRVEVPVFVDRAPDTYSEEIASGNQARLAGDYDRALEIFQAVLAENPTVTSAYLGIGDVHVAQKDYTSAVPAFNRARRLEPESFDAQYGHAFSLQMLHRFAESVASYHRALDIDPEDFDANLNLAIVYVRLEAFDRAAEFAERALVADPTNGPVHANLGALYEKLDRYPEAIEMYLQALELMGNRPPLMMNLIQALAHEKRYREAANTAETLTRVAPSAEAFERLGWCLFKLGDYTGSQEAYLSAVTMDDDYWPALNGVGVNALNAWLLSERTDDEARVRARDAFRRSLQANPEQPKITQLLSNYRM